MFDVIACGELLIDFVSLESGVTLAEAPAFKKAAGGAPANVAVGVARLGHRAGFMGQVGDDPFGHFLADTLRDAGDEKGAETAYRKAITDDPTVAPPYLNLVELLWRQGRDEEALAVIDQGLAAVSEENRARLEAGRQVLTEAEPQE